MREGATLRRHAWLISWLVPLLLTACAKPPPPNSVEGGAYKLGARTLQSQLNCPRKDCVHWYRTDVAQKGTLNLDLRDLSSDATPAGFSVTVAPEGGASVMTEPSMGRREVRIQRRVRPARYLIALRSDKPGRAFPYSIKATFVPAPPPAPPSLPPPPEPKFEAHETVILEAEGWGQDVTAVLVESGEREGIWAGLQGRLMNRGEEIGALEVEQVFSDGSRLVVVGPLSDSVGAETVVEILIPVEIPIPVEVED
jgi:hypothetical protein